MAREYRDAKARFLTGVRRLQPHINELPPNGRSVNHHHSTEAAIYYVRGRGYSTIQYESDPEHRLEWAEGDLFGVPLWAWHQHINSSDTDTVRYLAVQDTLGLKAQGLHQIERHPNQ